MDHAIIDFGCRLIIIYRDPDRIIADLGRVQVCDHTIDTTGVTLRYFHLTKIRRSVVHQYTVFGAFDCQILDDCVGVFFISRFVVIKMETVVIPTLHVDDRIVRPLLTADDDIFAVNDQVAVSLPRVCSRRQKDSVAGGGDINRRLNRGAVPGTIRQNIPCANGLAIISDTVLIAVPLVGIWDRRTIIAYIADLITVAVFLGVVGNIGAIVAYISEAIPVIVRLIRVCLGRTIIYDISDPVIIVVIITGITPCVTVQVSLIGVRDCRAIVASITLIIIIIV